MVERYGARAQKQTVQFGRKGWRGLIEGSEGHLPQLAVTPSRTDLAGAEARAVDFFEQLAREVGWRLPT
jgi:hypothetical protein